MDCDSFYELGPPPDWILSIPPPPVPSHMADFVSRLASEGINIPASVESSLFYNGDDKACNMCQWADGSGVGFVELAQKGPIIDDTWFLVIISSCVGAALVGIIIAIALFKYREGKLKPLSDVVLAKKEKALGLERCEAVLYPNGSQDSRASRALWAGLKTLEGNHYTVDHCQPMDQKPSRIDLIPTSDATYDYAHYPTMSYPSIRADSYAHTQLKSAHVNGPKDQEVSFENVAYDTTDEKTDKIVTDPRIMSRAAYMLGTNNTLNNRNNLHHYEMVTPQLYHTKKLKTLERGGERATPIISAPTNISATLLPPLNSRYSRRYTFTGRPNGTHTLLPSQNNKPTQDHKYMHVSLDRCGHANTNLADLISPADHIYASPITSPVI